MKKSPMQIHDENNKKMIERTVELFKQNGTGYSYSSTEMGILKQLGYFNPQTMK